MPHMSSRSLQVLQPLNYIDKKTSVLYSTKPLTCGNQVPRAGVGGVALKY